VLEHPPFVQTTQATALKFLVFYLLMETKEMEYQENPPLQKNNKLHPQKCLCLSGVMTYQPSHQHLSSK